MHARRKLCVNDEKSSRQLQYLVGTEEKANQVAILRAKSSLTMPSDSFPTKLLCSLKKLRVWAYQNCCERGRRPSIGSHETEKLVSEYFGKKCCIKTGSLTCHHQSIGPVPERPCRKPKSHALDGSTSHSRSRYRCIERKLLCRGTRCAISGKREQAAPSVRNIPAVTAFSLGPALSCFL